MRARLLGLTPIFLAAALYLPSAACRAVLDVDEALYVQAAREMTVRHDWVTPRVNGVRFLDKPPLLYWMLAGLYRVFGTTEFAAHLPPALAVIATTALLVRLGTRAGGPAAGFATGLCFALSAGTYLFTRETLHDGLLVFFMVAGMDAFDRWSGDALRPTTWLLVFSAALAGGALSKGLVGMVLPLLVAGVCTVVSREPLRLRLPQALLGGSFFLLLAAPWHLLASLRNSDFWTHYVLNEQVLRFVNRREPLDFTSIPLPLFLGLLLVWLFPWTAFLPALVVAGGADAERGADGGRVLRLAWVWAIVVVAFFSASARLEHYAFPALPPLAILLGTALSRDAARFPGTARTVTWGFRALAGLGLLTGTLGVASALWVASKGPPLAGAPHPALLQAGGTDFSPLADLPDSVVARLLWPAALAAVALGLGLAGASWLDAKGHRHRAILALGSTMIGVGFLAQVSLRICEDVVSSKRFGQALAAPGLGRVDHVVVVGDYETANSMGFYEPRPLEIVDGEAPTLAAGLRDRDAPRVVRTREEVGELWRGESRVCVLAPTERLEGLGLSTGIELTRSLDRILVCNRSGGGTPTSAAPGAPGTTPP